MAQVKKLQQGGTLNINGKEYTVEQINEYLSSGQFDAQERASLAGTVRAMQEGKARYLDANSNSLSGDGDVNEDFAEYFGSQGRANRGRSGWSVRKQNRHASRNTDFAIRDRALAKLGGIENYLSSGEAKTKTTDTTKLGKGNGWFYTDGKYIKGPQNTTNEKHIRDVFSYLGSDDEGRKAWELVNWGDDMTALSNWYTGQSADDLLGRIQSNSLTDEDKEVLSYMGYTPTEADVVSSAVASDRDRFAKAGYDYDTWSGIIDFDKDGNAVLRTGEDGKTAFSSLGGNGNYFFNDSFFTNGQNSNLSFLKDHFVIDGKVYKASDASVEGTALYNILRQAGGFYDKNRVGDWEGADSIIKHLWDGRTNYSLGSGDTYSKFLAEHPEYRWTSITGAYDAPLSPGEQLIEFYDPSGSTDAFGYGQAKWAVLDQDGNFLRFVDSRGNSTGKSASALTGKKIARTETGNSTYDGLIVEDLVDKDGESTGVTLFRDPNTGNFIYRGRIRGANVGDNQDYIMPQSIAQILNKPEYASFWDKLKSDRQLQRQFERTLGDTINSGFRDMFTWNTMSKKNWMELGFSKEDAEMLVEEFDKYASNAEKSQRTVRRANRLIDQIEIQRNGGTISKFQPGGAVGTTESKGHTEKRLNTDFKHADNFAAIGDGKWEGLTGADWAEIGALVADMTGLGLGLTGAPIASGIAGAIGSTASFGADLSRDSDGDGRGFEWKDVGQYAGNLALDAISLAPFLGAAAQGGKAAKAIKSAGKLISKVFGNPIVMKSLAGMGIGSAVYTSANKIINGEEWTVRDIRNVLNGLSGALTLKKTGVFRGKGTAGVDAEVGEINVKLKGSDAVENVKLKKDVLDAVNKPNTTDVDAKLKQAIVAELNAKGKKINGKTITVDDIDLTPAKVKTKRTWKHPIKGEATDSYDFNIKTVTEPGELLATTGPEATRRGVVDQFNNWLKTGKFVEVRMPHQYRGISGAQARLLPKEKVYVGQPQEYGDPFNWGLDYDVPGKQTDLTKRILAGFRKSYRPSKISADQRALLRRASIFTPTLTSRGENIEQQVPMHFVPVQTIIPAQSLSDIATRKNGGVIKAQGGLKFSEWDAAKQQRFKDAKAAAEASGKASFDFEGVSYGVTKGADLPEVPSIIKQPTDADLNNSANWTTYKDGSATYNGPGSFEYSSTPVVPELSATLTSDIPTLQDVTAQYNKSQGIATNHTAPILAETYTDYMNDYEANDEETGQLTGLSLENTLSHDIATAGYDKNVTDKLLKVRAKSAAKAAMDAARQTAGNAPGQNVGRGYNPNLSNIFRGGKLINAFNADQFQRKMARNVYDSTMRGMASNAQEYYNRFQDFGIIGQYKQYADNLRKPIVNVHSDVNSMYANQIARNDQALKAELEGGLKASQLYSDWLDQINDAKKTYAVRRMETENANRLRASAAENAYWTQMGASRAQRQNVIDNALTEQLSLYNQDRAMNYQLADQNETLQYNTNANNIKSIYQNQLTNAITAGTMSKDATLDDYFAANPTKYQEYVKQMTDLQNNTLTRRMDNYKKYNQQSIFSAKKGGSIEKKQRSASDQIWIDNQKISADAIKQLSKQAFEFLKMALS